MANVKDVKIDGSMPHCVSYDNKEAWDTILKFLGQCNMPIWGLNFHPTGGEWYDDVPETGGVRGIFAFTVQGKEAVWEDYLREFCEAIVEVGGEIEYFGSVDLDNLHHG